MIVSIHRFLPGLHQGWWKSGNILILPFYLLAGILLYRKAFKLFYFLFFSILWTHGFLLIYCVEINSFFVCTQNLSHLASRSPTKMVSVACTLTPVVFHHFLISDRSCSLGHLQFSGYRTKTSLFTKDLCFLLLVNGA